ncbi:MAG: hypothetical protein WEC75_07320 [Dehalococcoidia bacterium]
MTLSLRPLRRDDASWLQGWLPAVARSVGHDDLAHEGGVGGLLDRLGQERSLRARIVALGGEEVGIVVYRAGFPRRGASLFEMVAVAPEHARRGAGLGAAGLVEQELQVEGMRMVYAPAPAIHGIDVYFWIRLGYRPLLRDAWPCALPGVAWLVREIAPQTKGRRVPR